MTPEEAISSQSARLQAVGDALDSDTATAAAEVRSRVDQWHAQAQLWISLGPVILGAPERAGEWGRLGEKLADNARNIAEEAESETASARIFDFAAGMPGALLVVSQNAVKGAAAAVGFVADEAAGAAGHVAKAAGRAVGDVLGAALGAIPWPVYAVAGVALVAVLYIAVRAGPDALKTAAAHAVP